MPPRDPPPPPHHTTTPHHHTHTIAHAHKSTSALHHQPSGALASHDAVCAKPSALLSKAQAHAAEALSAGHKAAPCPPSGAAGSARSVTGGRGGRRSHGLRLAIRFNLACDSWYSQIYFSRVWCLGIPYVPVILIALKLANLMSARREPHTVASHPLGLFGQQPLRARSQSQTQL